MITEIAFIPLSVYPFNVKKDFEIIFLSPSKYIYQSSLKPNHDKNT